MLARGLRLPRRAFGALSRARRSASSHFGLSFSPAGAEGGGCAVIVSKKVAALSVDRHVLKRRVLSVIEPWCDSGQALVIVAKTGAAALSFSALKRELTELLSPLTHSEGTQRTAP